MFEGVVRIVGVYGEVSILTVRCAVCPSSSSQKPEISEIMMTKVKDRKEDLTHHL